MRIDQRIYLTTVRALATGGGGNTAPWSEHVCAWCLDNRLPQTLLKLFETDIPKSELWAGAGVIFDENAIVRWNDDYPEARGAKLLLIGSAPNGDFITIDLEDGSIGYISHEQNWRPSPRNFFIPVSPSIGQYLRDVNNNPPSVPDDYWGAKSVRDNLRNR